MNTLRRIASTPCILLLALFLAPTAPVRAGSATWNLNPSTNSWTTAGNWTPATVPNGASDVATFGASNTTEISLAAPSSSPLTLTLDSLVFNPNAAHFAIDVSKGLSSTQLVFTGAGIVNNSEFYQYFNVSGAPGIVFSNSAAAGDLLFFIVSGSTASDLQAASSITFKDNTFAGDMEIDALGSATAAAGNSGGQAMFLDAADGFTAAVDSFGGQVAGAAGGLTVFDGTATLDSGAAIALGGAVSAALGGTVIFQGHATAGNGGVLAEAGGDGGAPGVVFFNEDSTGGTSNCFLFGGIVDISQHNPPGVTVGVLAGNGTIYVGSNNFATSVPNTFSTFDGTIQDGGAAGGVGGSFTCGGGVTLTNASTYTGGTIIDGSGFLRLAAPSGSAVGSGPVQIFNGTLAGTGSVPNTVVVGTGSGPRAWLIPELTGRATITIRKNVLFKADATYFVVVSQKPTTATKAAARGVRIESGATINVTLSSGSSALRTGTVYTALQNTSTLATVGTFANLPDGGTVIVGTRTLQANYEGGDGNDLTLTVLP